MASVDPIFIGILVALVLFFFFIYLFIRRTMTGFREGFKQGKQ